MARYTYVKKENLEDVISGIEKKVPKAVPSVILKKEVIWEGVGTELNQELELSNDIENYDEVEIYMVNGDGYHTSSNSCLVEATPFNLRSQWVYRNLTLCCAINVSFLGAKRAKITESANLGTAIHLSKIIGVKYTYEKNIPNASPTAKGKAKLYDALGNNEDGAISQKAVTEAIHSMGSGIGDWTANTEYSQGISVIYNHVLYKCTADHTSGITFAPTYWNKIGVDASGDTFTGDVEIDDHSLLIKDHELAKGTNPLETKTNSIKFVDSSGNDIGSINHSIDDNGVATTEILANEYVAGDTTHKASIGVSIDAEGNATTSAPTTPDDSEGTQIVTADFLKDSLATKILKPWTANTQYKLNTTVVNNHVIYKCITAHTSTSTFDDTKWEMLGTNAVIVSDWAASTAYKVDEVVTNDNDLYKCTTAHTSGAEFDDTNWQKIGVDREGDTFTGLVTFTRTSSNNVTVVAQDIGSTKGTTPSANKTLGMLMQANASEPSRSADRYGSLLTTVDTSGNVTTSLRAYKNETSSTAYGEINVSVDISGNVITSAPNATGSGSAPIMTTAGGTFTGDITMNTSGNTTALNLKSNNFTKGDTPSAEKTTGVFFRDGTSTGNSLGSVHNFVSSAGEVTTVLRAYKNEAGSSSSAYIYIRVRPDGTVVTYAPTPDATSNNTNIATTAWVKNYTSGTCTNTSSVSGGNIRWYKNGRMATITLFNVKTSTTSSGNIQLTADAPKALTDMYMTAVTISGKTALVHVNATGSVVIYNNITTTEGFFGTVSYPTSDVT